MIRVRLLSAWLLASSVAACAPSTEPASESARPTRAADTGPLIPAVTAHATPAPTRPPAQVPHTVLEGRALELVDTRADEVPGAILVDDVDWVATSSAELRVMDASDAAAARTAEWWSAGAILRWHEIARQLTARRHLNSSYSSRMFAALTIAQHDAAFAARKGSSSFPEGIDRIRLAVAGRGLVEARNGVSQEAAIAYASAEVLRAIFPADARFLGQNALAHVASRVWSGANAPIEIERGRRVGEAVAARIVERLEDDGASRASHPRVAAVAGRWFSERQTLPGWSRVRPWVMDRPDQFRAPPPPAIDSAEFAAALDEIRSFSARRSAEQLAIANYWNLGVGGISVPGMWGQLALDEAYRAGWPELRVARLLAVLHMAMADACIASWDTKFHYLVPRPSMLASEIDEPLGLPSHPSYTSGHSAFSGAAQAVLSAAFPETAEHFAALAEEASASRFYGGIHYRFDGDQGLVQGRRTAALALEKYPIGARRARS